MWPEIVFQILAVLQSHDRAIGKTGEDKEKKKKRGGKKEDWIYLPEERSP